MYNLYNRINEISNMENTANCSNLDNGRSVRLGWKVLYGRKDLENTQMAIPLS